MTSTLEAPIKRFEYRPPTAISEWQFTSWLQESSHGDSIVYASTTLETPSGPGFEAARRAYQAGLVALVQRRAEFGIEYVAQRTVK